mgnify:CR=1 FL=1
MTTRTVLDQDMLAIRDDILRLGSLVAQALDRAFQALKTHDPELAQTVVNDDTVLDNLHAKIEDAVTKTVALQQPMARDLRKLVADLLISNELERMGDHAESIARGVANRQHRKPLSPPPQCSQLRDSVANMLSQIMDAYVDMDADKARAVAALDDQADQEFQSLLGLLIQLMGKGELAVEDGTFLVWAGHNLERIGDRVTNISERIVYARIGEVEDFNPKPDERE